jgi:hypothetical protein
MTVATIIEIAKISQYLSLDDKITSVYKGGVKNKSLPQIIYLVRKAVEWLNTNDPSDESLPNMANYLYTICGKFGLQAQSITGSGGTVTPTTPGGSSTGIPASAFYTADGSEGTTLTIATAFPDAAGKTIFSVTRSNDVKIIITSGTPTMEQVLNNGVQLAFNTDETISAGEIFAIQYVN